MRWRKTKNKNRERLVVKEYRGRVRPDGQSLDKYALDLWRDIVFARDGYRCRRCKRPWDLQGHHVHSRRFPRLKHDPDNGLTLCRGCHHWWHMNRETAYRWWEDQVGPEFAERLEVAIMVPCRNLDLSLVIVGLEMQHKALRRSGKLRERD